jgi:3'(2'), 5'-bisphosphate nucleotidase
MSSTQLSEEDIKFVDELAYQAGQMALSMREGVGVHTKSGPSDLVTDADLKISRVIIEALAGRFPQDLIVSEEDKHEHTEGEPTKHSRVWLIDPIDGTDNYVKRDGQYSSMIGLLVDGHPHYGWIYQPSTKTLFSGGPAYGAFKRIDGQAAQRYVEQAPLREDDVVRIMMGWGDRRRHPWVMNLPNVEFVQSQSLGLKIIKVLEDEADVFISLTGRVKLWDTAAPAAIALGNNLDAGTVEGAPLPYPIPKVQHGSSVIIGRRGAIAWAGRHIDGHTMRSVPKTFR